MNQLPTVGEWGNDLGQAFANIGQGVSNIMNPYQKQEQELRSRIAANPKLAQELFDQESQNPGSVSRLYGPNVAKWITDNRNNSVDSKVEMATRQAIDTGRTSSDIQQDKTALGNMVNRATAGVSQDVGRAQAAGATTAEAQASVAGDKAALEKAKIDVQLPNVRKEYEMELKKMENDVNTSTLAAQKALDAIQKDPMLANVDLMGLAKKFYAKSKGQKVNLSPEDEQHINALGNESGRYTDIWKNYLASLERGDSLELQRRHTNFLMQKENDDLINRATAEWSKIGKPGGSVKYLLNYMTDPRSSARAEQLAALPLEQRLKLSADDKALVQVAQAIASSNESVNLKEALQLDVQERLSNAEYRKAVGEKEPNDQAVSASASQLSSVLTSKAKRAGHDVMITATPALKAENPWGDKNDIKYGDLTYQVTEMLNGTPMTRTVDEAGLQELFLKPKQDRTPGQGTPQEPAYKGRGTTTVSASSDSYKVGSDANLDPWAQLTPAQRSAELRKNYPNEKNYKIAKQRLIDAGLTVY